MKRNSVVVEDGGVHADCEGMLNDIMTWGRLDA